MNDINLDKEEDGIAICGIAFRIPLDSDTCNKTNKELWNNLMNGFDGVSKTSDRWSDSFHKSGQIANNYAGLLPMEEIKSFDPLFFGINPSQADSIDPQQRLLLKCTWEALEDSMIDPMELRGSNTSVFIGCTGSNYHDINQSNIHSNNNIFASSVHCIANRISYCFDFHGISMTIDTACSSSLNAVHMGCQSIRNGTSEVSIAGGVNLIFDTHYTKGYTNLSMLTVSGRCKPFDADADGFVRSESVGIVIMKSLKQALLDGNKVYCVINGSSSNIDGNGVQDKLNFYSPSSISQGENIKQALHSTKGKVKANDIQYVEAHGTGTPTGDPIESKGIASVFKDYHTSNDPLLIGSFKSNIGHSEAASGIVSLIKVCLMFQNKYFVPSINYTSPNPLINFDEWSLKVVTSPIPFSNPNTSILINNFGITGSNCSMICSEFNYPQNGNTFLKNEPKTQFLIPFSTNSSKSLLSYQSMFMKSIFDLENDKYINVVNQSILSKSSKLFQRSITVASNLDELKDKSNIISNQSNDNSKSSISVSKEPVLVFIFAGQGPQHNMMGIELYNSNEIFKQSMDEIDSKFFKYFGYSILEKLRLTNGDSINNALIAQPTLLMIQISLFNLLKHWGIDPSFIVGHSFGEIPGSYCSGIISLDAVVYLTYHRGRLQDKIVGFGRMLSIGIGESEYIKIYSFKSQYKDLEIACFNSENSIVVAGLEANLFLLASELKENGIFAVFLGSQSSYHTSSQDIIKDDFLNLEFNEAEFKQPKIPMFSTVTTKLFQSDQTIFNLKYLFDNVRCPVLFNKAIKNLYDHIELNQLGNEIVFIEISPHPTLSFYLKQIKPLQSNNGQYQLSIKSVLTTLNKKKNDINEINNTICQIYLNGYNVNFKSQLNIGQHFNLNSSSITIPHYQWDDQLYWKNEINETKYCIENGPSIDICGISDLNTPNNTKTTIIDTDATPFKYLKGHMVGSDNYFPGSGYIESILTIYQGKDIVISNLEFNEPFILSGKKLLSTSIFETSKNKRRLLFHFKDLNETDEKWVLSSSGNILLSNNNSTKDKIDIDKLKLKCNYTTVLKDDLYSYIKKMTGLSYCGSFKRVDKCLIGNNCSFSFVSLKSLNNEPIYGNENLSWFINSSIIDCCLHGMVGSISFKSSIVFNNIQDMYIYSSNFPTKEKKNSIDHLVSYCKFIKKENDSFYFSIKVMLPDGLLLLESNTVVCSSLTPIVETSINSKFKHENVYSFHLQQIDSMIGYEHANIFYSSPKILYNDDENISVVVSFYYHFLNQRNNNISIETISNLSIGQLETKFKTNSSPNFHLDRLFHFVFSLIKENIELITLDQNSLEFMKHFIPHLDLISQSCKITSKLLIPLPNDDPTIDSPHSLFLDDKLEKFYSSSKIDGFLETVSETIKLSLIPIIKTRNVIRIIEFGGGVGSLSIKIINSINKLIEDFGPDFQLDIEYTFTDISNSFKPHKLAHFKGNLLFKIIDISKEFCNESSNTNSLNQSYYDYVVMVNVLHVVKDVGFSVTEIYKILKPNGQLIFIESPYKSTILDCIFGIFNQWWGFNDIYRVDRCCMPQESWLSLVKGCGFINSSASNMDSFDMFIIKASKPSINNFDSQETTSIPTIIFGNKNDKKSNQFINSLNYRGLKWISNINELKENLKEGYIVYFIKTLEITIDNFKEITLEYTEINKFILDFKLKLKHILILNESRVSNYLSSSVLGIMRYFNGEFPQLNLICIDFDNDSFKKIELFNKNNNLVNRLINLKNPLSKEYFILNGITYFERCKQELNLLGSFKESSFAKENQLKLKLNHLNLKNDKIVKEKLISNHVEIKVMAYGINYRDSLVYRGIISNSCIGHEFSGVITNIFNGDIHDYKIGDKVYGLNNDTSSVDYLILNIDSICHIPTNVNFEQAASIPAVYLTSIFSMFNVANFNNQRKKILFSKNQPESILIHAASGGVGLSALNILKWKCFTGLIFVTIGSEEKGNYLKDKYGDFITGIYSTKDTKYAKQIKKKLKLLGSNKNGVDLILNTISSFDYLDSNFKCLSAHGKIIDLSITHLSSNNFLNLSKFKHNFGYETFELNKTSDHTRKSGLTIISNAIKSEELELVPITIYSSDKVKDALEYINQRTHIGKIVISNSENENQINNWEGDSVNNQLIMNPNYESTIRNLGKTILMTGQTGLILDILKWISKFSSTVENIIILSKSTLKWELELLINKTKHENSKIKFYFKCVDVSNYNQIESSVNDIFNNNKNIAPIESIFHFAFEFISRDVSNIDMECLNRSHGAKTIGAINLHNLSIKLKLKLKQFIMASSGIGVLGGGNLASYISSCCAIDSLSRFRKSIGLPSICINWGYLETGYTQTDTKTQKILNDEGYNSISILSIIDYLDFIIQNSNNILATNLMIGDFNFSNIQNKAGTPKMKLDYQLNKAHNNYEKQVEKYSEESVFDQVKNKISEFLSIKPSDLNVNLKITNYGSDSLMSFQLKNYFDKNFQNSSDDLSIAKIQNFSISSIISTIKNKFNK